MCLLFSLTRPWQTKNLLQKLRGEKKKAIYVYEFQTKHMLYKHIVSRIQTNILWARSPVFVATIWTAVLYMAHYENTPIQIYRKFPPPKTENFQVKNFDIFHISA